LGYRYEPQRHECYRAACSQKNMVYLGFPWQAQGLDSHVLYTYVFAAGPTNTIIRDVLSESRKFQHAAGRTILGPDNIILVTMTN